MRIATRGSALALWQAGHVRDLLIDSGAVDTVDIVVVSTSGDRDKSTPLHEIGGKGIFVKEVQAALLDGRADMAVHSAKDMPAIAPDELRLGAVPKRGNPHDVLVGSKLDDLRTGARIGTGSVRRRAQLAAIRPDLVFDELRGNIATRLEKAKNFDAIVVAAAALERLGILVETFDSISVGDMVPQVGQGALAIECRRDDAATLDALSGINLPLSYRLFGAERAFLRELGGDCSLPAGAHAVIATNADPEQSEISLTGFLASEDLSQSAQLTIEGRDGSAVGSALARELHARVTR